LREAANRSATCWAALGDIRLDTLATDLKALGADPLAGLRKRRQQLLKEAERTRAVANDTTNAQTLADERMRQSRVMLEAAIASRESALPVFPEGVDTALTAARVALAASIAEKERVAAEFASLERRINERKDRIDAILGDARANVAKASIAVDEAQANLTKAMTDQASHDGRLIELRKLRDAENIADAEKRLLETTESHAALPVPDRLLADDELSAAQKTAATIRSELEGIEREIQRAHGALEQVGGAVARERLHDATEAFELAERQEREIEAEYEAWRLLLDQMKEADAAQASNLGQALVPAIAGRFHALTQRRYETVQLTAQLATEGIVVSGALRSTDHISVGTREQLSTLYRLSLAEYLSTAIVLDDQLVQSDDSRMDWFRGLLAEKAHSFQIVVFTCRPSDYLPVSALVSQGNAVHADTDGGFIRAVDLGRTLRRR
jgi:chromosome segregation ATPase